jgi:hypothetical protein
MFRWLKRRLLKEQQKLCFQNRLAIAGMQGYFDNNYDILERLSILEAHQVELENDLSPHNIASQNKQTELLAINRELRRLYDTTASRHVKTFDEAFQPAGGWRWYLRRF